MNESWIKLFRKFREWEWYDDPITKAVWLEILLTTNFEDKSWHGISIKRGQLLTSIESLREGLKGKKKVCPISIHQVRIALEHLKLTKEVAIQTTPNYTLITVNKYNDYQQVANDTTNDSQTSGKRVATTKEYKNIKKEKNNYKEEFDSFLKNFNEKAGGRNYKELKKRLELFSLRRKIFSLEQLLTATKNLFGSDFYSGNNDSHWSAEPEYLLRTDEQVDRFLNLDIKKQELIKL